MTERLKKFNALESPLHYILDALHEAEGQVIVWRDMATTALQQLHAVTEDRDSAREQLSTLRAEYRTLQERL